MTDAFQRTTLYNDNQAAVDWAAACTNKGTKHINLRENYVRENHQRGTTKVTHIPGKINASDLFTKELKDAAHFRACRDSFMVSRNNFLTHGHVLPSHLHTPKDLPYYDIRSHLTLEQSSPAQPRRIRASYKEVALRATLSSAPVLVPLGEKVTHLSRHIHSGQGGVDVCPSSVRLSPALAVR